MEEINDARESDTTANSDGQVKYGDVCRVGIRVPPFWADEPEIWFAQIEGQFAISGITNDATKFNYVIGHLDAQHSREVKDIIINPPTSDKYAKLKSELVKRLCASNEKKMKQLLMHEELGDRKPSQFLRHLRDLGGPNVPDDLLQTIWISRLPHAVQTVLAGQPTRTSLEDLSDLADRVNELVSTVPRVAAVADCGVPSSVVNELIQEVAELRKQFAQMNADKRHSRPQRDTEGRRRSRSSSRSKSNYQKHPLCWYHYKFGDKARDCIRPCDYKAGNAGGSR